MKEKLNIAIDFAGKIKNIKGILMIILFGSVARGESTRRSDIDIAIVYDKADKFQIMENVNKFKHDDIQTTFINIKDIPKETELVGAISGEGIILYGSPIVIQERKLDLRPMVLIKYDLTKLQQTEKVKLNRALYGSVSKSRVNKKEYITKTGGIIKAPGIEKIAKSVLLVDRKKSTIVKGVLNHFKVEFREIPFWTY